MQSTFTIYSLRRLMYPDKFGIYLSTKMSTERFENLSRTMRPLHIPILNVWPATTTTNKPGVNFVDYCNLVILMCFCKFHRWPVGCTLEIVFSVLCEETFLKVGKKPTVKQGPFVLPMYVI